MSRSAPTPAEAMLRLALVPGLGPVTAGRLLAEADHPGEIFSWPMERLLQIEGVGAERARKLCDPRGEELAAAEVAACRNAGVRIVTRADEEYPKALEALSDPPLALWLTGDLQPRDRLAIAVVGPRRPSAYGHRQGQRLSTGLARIGATLISGLARGIDTVAHQAAIDLGGRTIAVLGSGHGRLYPQENAKLSADIAAGHGCVLSEFPFNVPPAAGNFPRRNRLVAALSLAVLVIEAGSRSGALITARLAMELGRDVLALPGPVDNPECAGSNQLIRDGATLVASLDHILEEIDPLLTLARGAPPAAANESPRAASLSGREKQVYQLLDDTPRTVDDLVRVSGLPPSAVSVTLLSLELKRLAKKMLGGFIRAL